MLRTSHNTNKYQSIEKKKTLNLFFKKSIVSKTVRVESVNKKRGLIEVKPALNGRCNTWLQQMILSRFMTLFIEYNLKPFKKFLKLGV